MTDSMKIENRQFGTLVIDPEKIITFQEGILGFEEVKRYVIQVFEEYEPFHWLISVDEPDVIFPIISPKLVKDDYEPEVHQEDLALLGEYEDQDLLMYLIATIGSGGAVVTANLKGPIFINQREATGQQVVLEPEEYSLKYVFME